MGVRTSGTGSTDGMGAGRLLLRHFLRLAAPALALVVIFLVFVFAFLVPLLEQSFLQQKYDLCRHMVESAMSNLATERAEGLVAGRPLFLVQHRASERLRALRFGEEGKDYYWIIGADGRFLMHPYRPDLEGRDPAEVLGPDGEVLSVLIEHMNQAVAPGADGMVAYRWHWKDDLDRLVDKVSYVDRYEPWGWIVGTGVYVDDVEAELAELRRRLILAGLLMAVLSGGLAFLLSVRAANLQRSEATAHRRLAASEEHLRITLQSIGDGVVTTDIDGCVQEMNAVAETLTGWPAAEARGLPLVELCHAVDDRTGRPVASAVDEVLSTGEKAILPDHVLVLARTNTLRRVTSSGAPIRDRRGRMVGVVLVLHDVTEEHALQEQLRQVQKMEVIGQLAGGVAHDFNNMLAAIMGNAELLDQDLPAESPLRPLVTMILNGARRAADLTRKLLAFSRKGRLRSVALDVQQPIREAIALLRRSLDRNIRIETDFTAADSTVAGDPTLLQNAFLNLAVNARDAMPDGGLLTFTTTDVELSAGAAELTDEMAPGRYIEVAVGDSGVGMTPDEVERVFEPFYTTKPVGKGTGLGLAMVYGTVQEHGGAIRVQSRPGHGTTVRILLPRHEADAAAAAAPSGEVAHGEGLVLVVDDEELVRGMAEAQLRSLGYEVMTAGNGVEALETYRRHGDRIAVVLLDLVMPVMGGREALVRLRDQDPAVRVLLTSGFDPQGTEDDLAGLGAAGFLAKPYHRAALSQALREALAG